MTKDVYDFHVYVDFSYLCPFFSAFRVCCIHSKFPGANIVNTKVSEEKGFNSQTSLVVDVPAHVLRPQREVSRHNPTTCIISYGLLNFHPLTQTPHCA